MAKSKVPKNSPDAKAGIAAYRRVLKKPEDSFAGTPGDEDEPWEAAPVEELADDDLDGIDPEDTGLPRFDSEDDAAFERTGALSGEAAKSLARLRRFLPRVYGKIPAKDNAAVLPAAPAKPKKEKESKYRRVAKFLILIGTDQAAKVLENLNAAQVEALSREIAQIRGITADEADEILEEFHALLEDSSAYSGPLEGGVEAARRLLYVTFGPDKGEALLRKSVPDARGAIFDFLEDFTGGQISLLLREEAPATIALVVSRINPKLAAVVLEDLSPALKAEIVRRLAYIKQASPDTVNRVAAALRKKARQFAAAGGEGETEVDGMGALTAILKHADISFGDRLIEELDEEDPELGRTIKERLYTLDDMILAENKPIQEKLREMSDIDIALLVKGRSPEFTEKILSNISANRRAAVFEEQEYLGPVLRRDVDAVAQEFLAWFRTARETGKIFLYTDEDIVI
ncbi:MAG: flagellar motor switch protein FliG [Treponema sp.]|jgi:flagellar motor switch protein FliG|nr:flagellar motor switch protein FliG [Treponema sp.]